MLGTKLGPTTVPETQSDKNTKENQKISGSGSRAITPKHSQKILQVSKPELQKTLAASGNYLTGSPAKFTQDTYNKSSYQLPSSQTRINDSKSDLKLMTNSQNYIKLRFEKTANLANMPFNGNLTNSSIRINPVVFNQGLNSTVNISLTKNQPLDTT